MKFGMPTLVEYKNTEECAVLCKKLGLDFVEINMSFPGYLAETLSYDGLAEISEKTGVEYTFHLDEQLDPFNFSKIISSAYSDIAKKAIELSEKLGGTRLNMHLPMGVYATLPEKRVYLSEVYNDIYTEKVIRFAELCRSEIGSGKTLLCIENTDASRFGFTGFQRGAIDEMLKYDCFALTLDTGHEIVAEFRDRDVYEKYPDRLFHMHLHDATREKGPHLPLGEGEVKTDEMLALAEKKNLTCLIEVKTSEGIEKSVNYLRRRGVKLG